MTFTLGTTVDLCMTYLLMLVSMILTLTQGHSGSAKAKINSRLNYLNEVSNLTSIKLATTVGHFLGDLDVLNVYMA